MSFSTDVTLPKNYTPKFPDRCIVCGCRPDSTTKIAHSSQNPVLVFLIPFLGAFGWSRLEVPIFRKCKPRFRLQRWGRQLVGLSLTILAVWIIMPHFKGWSHLTRKLVVGALCLLAISPYVIAEVYWPRFFETTAREDSVDYEFASSDYAAEFHLLNEAQVLKSDVRAGPSQ